MKKIVTVQDLINELMLVENKDAEINIVIRAEDYDYIYHPNLCDFSIIDFTNDAINNGTRKNIIMIQVYR